MLHSINGVRPHPDKSRRETITLVLTGQVPCTNQYMSVRSLSTCGIQLNLQSIMTHRYFILLLILTLSEPILKTGLLRSMLAFPKKHRLYLVGGYFQVCFLTLNLKDTEGVLTLASNSYLNFAVSKRRKSSAKAINLDLLIDLFQNLMFQNSRPRTEPCGQPLLFK